MPFLLKAGKALHKRQAEIRVQFRHAPGNLYGEREDESNTSLTSLDSHSTGRGAFTFASITKSRVWVNDSIKLFWIFTTRTLTDK